jgi:DnaJ-class molecular chaperone
MEQDPYAVLGVTRAASDEDVEEAFRRLTRRRAEPDDEVLEAYKVLSHPRRRLRYDCFGVRTRRRRQAIAATGIPPIPISLEWYEAERERGVTKAAVFAEPVLCADCQGRGYEHGVKPDVCPRCEGSGHLSLPEDDPEEFHVLDVSACLACEGRGHVPAPRCGTCSGTGATVLERSVTVRIPPRLSDGDRLWVDGVARPFQLWVGARPVDSGRVAILAGIAFVFSICLLIYLLLH